MRFVVKLCECGDAFFFVEKNGSLRLFSSPYGTGDDAYRMLATMPEGSTMTLSGKSLFSISTDLLSASVKWLRQLRKASEEEVQ